MPIRTRRTSRIRRAYPRRHAVAGLTGVLAATLFVFAALAAVSVLPLVGGASPDSQPVSRSVVRTQEVEIWLGAGTAVVVALVVLAGAMSIFDRPPVGRRLLAVGLLLALAWWGYAAVVFTAWSWALVVPVAVATSAAWMRARSDRPGRYAASRASRKARTARP